ncbi:hypothetical protein SLOPH_694 [Spraguea lophii 42_110]|uniref:USP domain-containing protein n=1 Tax=Spraguea lophii (strain 42_110) TaxID=1358809 RepID=S7XUV0_SPRLO|nr:hypothetical protein SLOPH_694 [Spraguea lophii 42_110]
MKKSTRILFIIATGLSILGGTIFILSFFFKSKQISYRNENGDGLCRLKNYTGICYFNTVMQCLYSTKAGKFFLDRKFEEGTIENEMKKMFIKMKNANGACINLLNDYKNMFRIMGDDKNDVDDGGHPSQIIGYIFYKIYNERKVNNNFSDGFDKYFKAIYDFYKAREEAEQKKGQYKKIHYPGGAIPFLMLENTPVTYIMKKYEYYKKSPPEIITLFPQDEKNIDKNNLKKNLSFTVNISGYNYILRCIGVTCGFQSTPHIYSLVRSGNFWYTLNDSQRIKRIPHRSVIASIESVGLLVYELC